MNEIVDYMQRHGFAVTARNYLALAFFDTNEYTDEMIEEALSATGEVISAGTETVH